MNAARIQNALQRDQKMKEKFLGVFAANTLPEKEHPSAYIANTDSTNEPGSHRVAFYTPEPGEIETFDSFGQNLSVCSPELAE